MSELICQKVIDYLGKQDKCINNRQYKQWMVLITHVGLKSKEQLETFNLNVHSIMSHSPVETLATTVNGC